ncbi:MAG: 50S ribosome-binding GTPase, partial [Gammaproteobacteria bacterium]|nr:50S ribosome-binding GTPase [Gammaproteobacteria bacterium]
MQKIALIGNPNCGKTTLFNLLTGANQKVGNWPGVTIEKKFGHFKLEDESVELVDLPGIYSLEQGYSGIDEKIAQDYLEQGDISLIINIVDATNLERSLVLTQQLM